MEKFSVSKMTVRKAISYLVSTGSLISIKGSGVFVSKFILPNTYETLREVLDIDEVTTVEISTKIPQILLNIASTKETHSDFIAFLRTYKKNNVNIAYSIN
ncbi:MAG: hypothetical protein DRP42_03895 [Tenericutes bacterium]|nr:MAG: hypothetical protein DRP42_03895 [Mycoplasmatota bacterium]